MVSKLLKAHKANTRVALALAGAGAMGIAGQLLVTSASADTTKVTDNNNAMTLGSNVTAGSFDITKQASGEANFPVTFDRPSGVNAAALAGTLTQLGTGSSLYQSALQAVPDLGNSDKMSTLLTDALDSSNANYTQARQDIVGLINWYNGLNGSNKITTQDGSAYTTDNLDQPINVLAVAFSNKNSVNSQATSALNTINGSKTVSDVENALNQYQSGVSQPYEDAFSAYSTKVYAQGANLNSLSTYTALKPVLDAYQNMYANGASAIRKTLLDGQDASTEAGVTFFESAVLNGGTQDSGGSSDSSNTPATPITYNTRWVDDQGNPVATAVTGADKYQDQKDIPGYTYKTVTTDDSTHTKTYVYTKNPTPKQTTQDTTWVDENGNALKDKASGTYPDTKGDAIPGYTLVSTKTTVDADGNTHTVNVYKKTPVTPTKQTTEDTVWVDEDGKTLKDKVSGTIPDTKGNAIPGYTFVSTKTTTDADGNKHTVNVYKKTPEKAKPNTYWFDTEGNTLKPEAKEQTLPDNDGTAIPGYKLVKVYTLTAADVAQGGKFANGGFIEGDTVNIYEKIPEQKKVHTVWVDEQGNTLKAEAEGAYPDESGTAIPGYTLVSTTTDADGNVKNVYKKNVTPSTKPVAAQPAQESTPAQQLPKTGLSTTSSSVMSGVGAAVLSAIGLGAWFKRRRRRN